MSLHESNDTAAGIPLEAHVAELRSRRKAAARLYDGSTYFREECEIFKQYAREKGCYLAHSPEIIKRTPDDEGNEHQVWFRHTPGEFNPYGRRASRADRFTHTALGWCPLGAGPKPLPTDRVKHPTFSLITMPSLRTSNRYLVAKSSGQISDQVKVRVYDSSVFEGVHLKKNHALVALAKASRKKAAKAL